MLPRFQRGLELQCHPSGDLQQLLDSGDLSVKALARRGVVRSLRYLTGVLGREVEQQDGTEDFFLCLRLHAHDPAAQLNEVGLLGVPRGRGCRHLRISLRSEANYI